jgi:hypothetical protein
VSNCHAVVAFPSPPLSEIDHLTSPGAGLRLLAFDEIQLPTDAGGLGTNDSGVKDTRQQAVRVYDSEQAMCVRP